jgi:hypothetical protein
MLSEASYHNMTVGRIPSVEGGIQPTIVDAKGDLIAAVAADSLNRLAVGSNDQVLVADSAASTGLAWKSYGAQVVAGKNFVINGGFDIWQRGTSISLAASSGLTYVADRYTTQTNANQASTVSRQATGDTTNLPFIQYCLRYQRNSGQTGVARQYLVNSFETVNTIPLVGRTVTLSYYARAGANYSAASSILEASIFTGTGTDQNAFVYTGSSQIGATNATLTTTWQRFSLTVAIPTTVTELAPTFSWASVGTAGAADYFEVTGVQLELGSVPTSFSRAQGTIQGELAACQRYLPAFKYDAASSLIAGGYAYSTNNVQMVCPFPVSARVAPTGITVSNVTHVTWNSTGNNASTNITFNSASTLAGGVLVAATATSGTGGVGTFNNASGSILFTGCEL